MRVTTKDCINILESSRPQKEIIESLRFVFSFHHNILPFCEFFLPHAFSAKFCPVHEEVIDEFKKPNNSAVALPRGHGKSTLIGLGYALWLIVNKLEDYFVYTSQNNQKTIQFLEPIQFECKYNKLLRWVYPELDPKKVHDEEEGVDRRDCFDIMSMRIQALSFEKNVRGVKFGVRRPSLIILDDIEDDERVINPELRMKDANKLNRQIIPALSPTGRIKMIGTILHLNSLLVQKINLWDGKIYRAIQDDGTVLFPTLWSKEKLDAKKYDIGSTEFEQEYQNNPVDNTKSIIKSDWIKSSFDESVSYGDESEYDERVIGCDFAFADRITADKSAFLGLGKHYDSKRSKNIYTPLFIITEKGLSTTQQFDYLQHLSTFHNIREVVMEENSIRSMSTELVNYDFDPVLYWMSNNDPSPEQIAKREEENIVHGTKRYTIGKKNAILRLATLFENGLIRLPYKTADDKRRSNWLKDELTTFALKEGKLVETGIHSDIGIALLIAVERLEMKRKEFYFSIYRGGSSEEVY